MFTKFVLTFFLIEFVNFWYRISPSIKLQKPNVSFFYLQAEKMALSNVMKSLLFKVESTQSKLRHSGERRSRHHASDALKDVDSWSRLLAFKADSVCASVFLNPNNADEFIVALNEKHEDVAEVQAIWESVLNTPDEGYVQSYLDELEECVKKTELYHAPGHCYMSYAESRELIVEIGELDFRHMLNVTIDKEER